MARAVFTVVILVGLLWVLLMAFRVPLTMYRTYIIQKDKLNKEIKEIEEMYNKNNKDKMEEI